VSTTVVSKPVGPETVVSEGVQAKAVPSKKFFKGFPVDRLTSFAPAQRAHAGPVLQCAYPLPCCRAVSPLCTSGRTPNEASTRGYCQAWPPTYPRGGSTLEARHAAATLLSAGSRLRPGAAQPVICLPWRSSAGLRR
jgi:hypothetical protein